MGIMMHDDKMKQTSVGDSSSSSLADACSINMNGNISVI